MDHARLIAALRKNAAKVERSTTREDAFIATKGDKCIVWFTQQNWQKPERRDATCVRWQSPQTDSQTDCFCDRYFDTIKGAVAFLG